MISTPFVKENLKQSAILIKQAVENGSELVALPEYFGFMGFKELDKLNILENDGVGVMQDFLAQQASLYKIWIIGGSLPLAAPGLQKVFNSTLVYNPEGQRIARYDKIHLFSFHSPTESYEESVAIKAGDQIQTFHSPLGTVGLSICYDLRFPELYRALGQVNLIVVLAAFTYATGRAHWEVLLRARAIENQCYLLAAAQGGRHVNGRHTWGHSMLIDPWGEILEVLPNGEGIVTGEIDFSRIAHVRICLPALCHRRL